MPICYCCKIATNNHEICFHVLSYPCPYRNKLSTEYVTFRYAIIRISLTKTLSSI